MSIPFIVSILVLFACGFYFIGIGISGMIADKVITKLEGKIINK
jgi:hypothetical protein